MEATVRQALTSSSPLSTISPRRILAGDTSSRVSHAREAEQQQDEQALRRQEQQYLQRLRARDREVRSHEAAHLSAGRPYVRSGPTYVYQQGPDGRSYAIGGEVRLDTSAVAGDPQATLEKAEQIRRAALAPAQPSPQDAEVAASASQMAARARIEIAVERREQASQQPAAANATGPANSNLDAFSSAQETPSIISQFA
jgi:hypothetical protein